MPKYAVTMIYEERRIEEYVVEAENSAQARIEAQYTDPVFCTIPKSERVCVIVAPYGGRP